ncbi:DUF4240 domain-containing protein [Catelliglobosispora koreensis]|uniref:DUF4240 domain-containing protein n=1 Tax=Catelliglobosispora koreensis TaxID=129052 RepID=UPI00036213EB|nr:DUF4240 domain-containing protein [Catelliglobosispora koreensis]
MDDKHFWEVITGLRRDNQGDIAAMTQALASQLPGISDPVLAGFADRWSALSDQADSWGLIEAATVAFGYMGDDGMNDVRNWLICQGPEAFGRVLGNPDCLLDYLSPAGADDFASAERFTSVLWNAIEQRPAAASLMTHHSPLRQPSGERTDLSDPFAVQSKYPRCKAAHEAYLAKPLPTFFVSLKEPESTPKRPTPSLSNAWVSRRREAHSS